ncbi:MAG: RNA-binding protein [Oligoflexia bacterium]|nr:RNA-binding protein [Oligoflexia bacterium]
MTKIYVGNLAWSTTEEDLSELFSKFGAVENAKIVKDRETGRSKGFGFVDMSSSEEMEKAISGLDGTDFKERAIKVSEAKSTNESGGGNSGPNRFRGGNSGSGPRRGGSGSDFNRKRSNYRFNS